VAALLEYPDGAPVQVALFRLLDGEVRAVQQLDPYSGANVMSRGIVGTRGGEPTVAGPVYKQVFALRSGDCLESGGKTPLPGHGAHLATFPVEVRDGVVLVGLG
jgi:nitrite reductase (NADH) small subunit